MTIWVDDAPGDTGVHFFAHADSAGDSKVSRSPSGLHLTLLGPYTAFRIVGRSKKQGRISHQPTLEAELVPADHALRTAGLPRVDMWDLLHEDSDTANGPMLHGYSLSTRHIAHTGCACAGSPSALRHHQ